jgi:uroporphyrinogen decarboxylase
MKGKELVETVFKHQKADAVPWVPFAGVHAGKLCGYSAGELSKDASKLTESLKEVNRIYKPDGQPVMFDLQLEAEVLGCKLQWSDTAPPMVSSHPLENSRNIPDHLPNADEGRIPVALSAMKEMKKAVGDSTALYGLFCGPFTLASHLRGTAIFMDMIDDPDYVKQLLDFSAAVCRRMADLYEENGMDVLASVDPLVSQISPDHFSEFLSKPYEDIFTYIREKNLFSSFFVCGDATKNIEVMCKTNPDGIAIDENIKLVKAKKITDKYNIVIGGNIPLTTVMLFGSQQDNMKYVIDLLDSVSKENLIISPGCDMPYDVPVENGIAVEQAVHYKDKTRKMIAHYEHEEEDIDVDLPEYKNLEKPLIEVFTLDSDTCAACTYMYQSAMDAKREYDTGIDIVEYKFTDKENIPRFKKMGIKQLPCIYINGELKFSSIIPGREALNKEIERAMSQTGT